MYHLHFTVNRGDGHLQEFYSEYPNEKKAKKDAEKIIKKGYVWWRTGLTDTLFMASRLVGARIHHINVHDETNTAIPCSLFW